MRPIIVATAFAVAATGLSATGARAELPRRLDSDESRTVEQVAVGRVGTGLMLAAYALPGKERPIVAVLHQKTKLAAVTLRGSKLEFTPLGAVELPLIDGLEVDVGVRDLVEKDLDGDRKDEVFVTVEGRGVFKGTGDGSTHALYVLSIGPDGAPTLQLAHELRFQGNMKAACESHAHARAIEWTPEDMLGDDHVDLRVTTRESKRDCEAPTKPCSGEVQSCKTVNTQSQELFIWKDGHYEPQAGQ